jgi:hypothetical protein
MSKKTLIDKTPRRDGDAPPPSKKRKLGEVGVEIEGVIERLMEVKQELEDAKRTQREMGTKNKLLDSMMLPSGCLVLQKLKTSGIKYFLIPHDDLTGDDHRLFSEITILLGVGRRPRAQNGDIDGHDSANLMSEEESSRYWTALARLREITKRSYGRYDYIPMPFAVPKSITRIYSFV